MPSRRGLAIIIAVIVVLSIGVVGWWVWPRPCGGVAGMGLNSDVHAECIGITDGSFFFNSREKTAKADQPTVDRINAVEQKIAVENKQVVNGGTPYVKMVLLMPLTVSKRKHSAISLQLIEHSLEGAYTALWRTNHTTQYGDPHAVQVELLLANQGSRQESSDSFVDQILHVSEERHPLVAVIGLGSSVENTKTVADKLSAAHIPMVSAVTSADTFTDEPGMWNISPGNATYVQALKSYLDHQTKPKYGMVVYDQNSADLYTRTLKQDYDLLLSSYLAFPSDQPFSGTTLDQDVDQPGTAAVFVPVVNNICTAAHDPRTPLDMVFYAGRLTDFYYFAKALDTRMCSNQQLTVLVGSTGFAGALAYDDLLKHANVSVVVAASSDALAWLRGGQGVPPDFAAFAQSYQQNGFTTDGLDDGYATAHHDALATAAMATRLAALVRTPPFPQDVGGQFGRLNLGNVVPGAVGRLNFPADHGRATGRTISYRFMGITTGLATDVKPFEVTS